MDIIVVGSCNTDLISYIPRLPRPGETIHGHKFSIGFGGKGANQCIAAARLGSSVAMVAKLGADLFGDQYLQNLKDNGVNIDHVKQTDEAQTGVAPIAVDDQGQNSIVIVSGANMLLSLDDVKAAEAMIKSAKIMLCQLEINPATTLAALKLARTHGVTTILNPAPAKSDLDQQIYKYCDILCPNETEAEMLAGTPVKCVDDAKQVLPVLLDKGCGSVIITLGEEGSVFVTQDNRSPSHIKTDKVNPTDTTGAGDAFIGALGYFLAKHRHLGFSECIRRANAIATISVQSPGTQSSYPWKKDLPDELFS